MITTIDPTLYEQVRHRLGLSTPVRIEFHARLEGMFGEVSRTILAQHGVSKDGRHLIRLRKSLTPPQGVHGLLHELRHAYQAETFPHRWAFENQYVRNLNKYGYAANPFEVDADDFAERFAPVYQGLVR